MNLKRGMRGVCLVSLLLVAADAAAGQAVETIPVDLTGDTLHDVEDIETGTLVRIHVTNINPFAGRYEVKVGNVQTLPSPENPLSALARLLPLLSPATSAAELVARMLAAAGAGAPQSSGMEVKGLNIPGEPDPGAQIERVPPPCPLAPRLEALADGLHAIGVRIDPLLTEAGELRTELNSIGEKWASLRSSRERSRKIQRDARRLAETIRDHLGTLVANSDTILVEAMALELTASAITALAAAATQQGTACDSEQPRFVRALQAKARADALKALVAARSQQVSELEELRTAIRQVTPSDYQTTQLVPLQNQAGVVDVTVVVTPWEATDADKPRVVATRRILFREGAFSRIRFGVGFYGSSIPAVTYRAEEIAVAGVSEPVYRVSTDVSQNYRLIPAVVAEIPVWRRVGVVVGVGSHIQEFGQPNGLLGVSGRIGSFSIALAGSVSTGEELDGSLRIGSSLPSREALRRTRSAGGGWAVGVNWIPRWDR